MNIEYTPHLPPCLHATPQLSLPHPASLETRNIRRAQLTDYTVPVDPHAGTQHVGFQQLDSPVDRVNLCDNGAHRQPRLAEDLLIYFYFMKVVMMMRMVMTIMKTLLIMVVIIIMMATARVRRFIRFVSWLGSSVC